MRAHRFAWEITFGPVPAGMIVCHHCDTPACVNPSHLFLGTHEDNAQDRERKGRGISGERHHKAKLTAEKAVLIRTMRAAGTSYPRIGKAFGISGVQARNVAIGKHWSS